MILNEISGRTKIPTRSRVVLYIFCLEFFPEKSSNVIHYGARGNRTFKNKKKKGVIELKRVKMAKFFLLREKIREEIANNGDWLGRKIGEQREKLVAKILEELKESGIICGFVPSGRHSYPDIKEGVDFYAVRIGEEKYQVVPLSITGKAWVEKHKERHPEIPVVEINSWESYEITKGRIVNAIKQYQ